MWLTLSLQVVTNAIKVNPVISCGFGHNMDYDEDIRDLRGGDCDARDSDNCVYVLSPTTDIY